VTGPPTSGVDHRRLAVELFNHVWTLLELASRTPEQDDELVHAAHASRWHWSKAGTTVNLARGEWQISRVYAVLGRAEPALWHAPVPRLRRGGGRCGGLGPAVRVRGPRPCVVRRR
jgi:hypothetical protein